MNRKLFDSIIRLTQRELLHTLKNLLPGLGYTPIVSKDETYLIAEGTNSIALLAHLDTVFNERTRKNIQTYYDPDHGVIWSPDGLGADDRAGVFMILSLIMETEFRPNLIFTTDEESALTGAKDLAAIPCPFKNLSYIIELDRQGHRECVFYRCGNTNFQGYIHTFGFFPKVGSYTDISVIGPAWDVACVNLSVGYYEEHSYAEYLNLNHWLDTYLRLGQMMKAGNLERWQFKMAPEIMVTRCDFCDRPFTGDELSKVIMDASTDELLLCDHCKTEAGVRTCAICGEEFLPYGNEEICDICYPAYVAKNNQNKGE